LGRCGDLSYKPAMGAFTLHLLRFLPRNLLSRVFGKIAAMRRPRWLARWMIRRFATAFDLNLEEATRPMEDYESLLDLFTRRLRPEVRPIDSTPSSLVSPVDARVGAFGTVREGMLLQAKGMPYSLASLLGGDEEARTFENGHFLTLYLSPRDYHRIHVPESGALTETRYEPGTLWPVNPPAVRRIPSLFAVNERVVSTLDAAWGRVAVVMVGATNVGRIRLSYMDLVTNSRGQARHLCHEPSRHVERGDELGVFELGSTVILVVRGKGFDWESLREGEWLPMGRLLGRIH